MKESSHYHLAVDGRELRFAVELLRRPGPTRNDEVIVGYDDARLTLEVGSKMASAHASGSWPGNARTSVGLINALAKLPPVSAPVVITCDRKHVTVDRYKFACRWQRVARTRGPRPTEHGWIHHLAASYTLSRAEIHAAGLVKEVAAAHTRLSGLLLQVETLLTPLGVGREDIRDLVEQTLEMRYVGRDPEDSP